MTPRAHILSTVSDTLGLIPEAVHDLTPLPEHNTAMTAGGCPKCRVLSACFGDEWSQKDDVFRTVGELVRFIEAREAEARG